MSDNQEPIKPAVLDVDDVVAMAPRLARHRRLVARLLRWLSVTKVNDIHARHCHTPGVQFTTELLREFDITLKVDNARVLDHLPQGAFVTISNHPFGALDGITLINLVGRHRPEFKVMVNMILNRIGAMRPNFIAVDAMQTDDPAKRAVSTRGIRQAMEQVRRGQPIGFFPAGAMSKVNWRGRLQDRQWQHTVLQLIQKFQVPVIPIFFNGSNSWWFNFLGVVCWQARTLRLPAEVWRKCHSTIHVSVGDPISVEEQRAHSAGTLEEFGAFLRERTYSLRRK